MLSEELPKIITAELPGPLAKALIERRHAAVPNGVGCIYPVVIDEACGAMIKDPDGNVFLDWVGGVGVLNVGHAHPELVAAVKQQSERFFHGMFNIVTHEGYVELAEKLAEITPVRGEHKKTFFANSGAEANENAVKIAKAYTKRPNIIVFSGAFHGRTLLTMAMTAKKSYARGMGPLPDGIYRADFPYLYRRPIGMSEQEAIGFYIDQLQKTFDESSPAEYVAAVVIEPLQGEGGFIPAPFEWVQALRKICDRYGILLIADEVQTGFGRTGRMFAAEYWQELDSAPDILLTAKSIAGGIPLSAVIARAEIMDAAEGGIIGGTYGGNALACAAGLAVLKVFEQEHLVQRSREIGQRCLEEFKSWQDQYEIIGDVRGLGAMIGIEFVKDRQTKEPATQIVNQIILTCAQNGLIIENAGVYGNVIRFLAPLVITDKQLTSGFKILEAAVKEQNHKGS